MKNTTTINVTKEYLDKATPGIGSFEIEDEYLQSFHVEEIAFGNWLFDTFGGNLILLSETNHIYLGKRADYLWNNRLWELKSIGSAKAADSALRKAIMQIRENPGGVILDFSKSSDSIQRTESVINERIRKSCRFRVDILLTKHKKLIKVLRYKK